MLIAILVAVVVVVVVAVVVVGTRREPPPPPPPQTRDAGRRRPVKSCIASFLDTVAVSKTEAMQDFAFAASPFTFFR